MTCAINSVAKVASPAGCASQKSGKRMIAGEKPFAILPSEVP